MIGLALLANTRVLPSRGFLLSMNGAVPDVLMIGMSFADKMIILSR